MNQLDFKGRTAVVTGGMQGIGAAIVKRLESSGAKVAVWDLDGPGKVDVSSNDSVQNTLKKTLQDLGKIDILVNNAGVALRRNLDELTEEDFDRTIATNLKSAFLCSQAVFPGMRSRGWGRIINISSGAARGAGVVGAHYNASKAGMEGLTRGYAGRLAKDGVTVNAVSPSLIATEMIEQLRSENMAKIPVGRLGTGAEVAAVVVMVAGNAYMTGQTVQVNGGLHFN